MSLADTTFEVEMRRDVARGASRLDGVEPGWWTEERIDTGQVNMRHVAICIAGWTVRTSDRFTQAEKDLVINSDRGPVPTFERIIEQLLGISAVDWDGDLCNDHGFDTDCQPAYDMLKSIWVDEINDRRNA